MLEKEDSPDPLRELTRLLRQLADVGSAQPALFPDAAVSASELVRHFDQRVQIVRETGDGELSAAQLESLTALENKLSTMARDGAEFDADIWTDEAVRTSERWAEVRALAAAAFEEFSGAKDGRS
jgi:hypothetical protein